MLSSYIVFAAAMLLSVSAAVDCPRSIRLALGSYTNRPNLPTGRGVGVTLAFLRPPLLTTTARFAPKLAGGDPSYIAPAGSRLYIANSNIPINGALTELTLSPKPSPLRRASRRTGGGTSHVAVLRLRPVPGVRHIIMVANYRGGSVATFVSRTSNALSAGATHIVPPWHARRNGKKRKSPFDAPHPHMVLPYRDGALVPDLGSNTVWRFRVDARTGGLRVVDRVRLRDGDGPRHAALHRARRRGWGVGDAIYVVNEQSLSLVVLRPGHCGRGLRSVCQRVALVDRKRNDMQGASAAAVRVSADGKFVYASVRKKGVAGRGLVVAFRVDAKTGRVLNKVGEFSSGGVHPRDFFVIERVRAGGRCKSFVAVVNRDSGNLVLFERNTKTGIIARKQSIAMKVKTPTSVVPY